MQGEGSGLRARWGPGWVQARSGAGKGWGGVGWGGAGPAGT